MEQGGHKPVLACSQTHYTMVISDLSYCNGKHTLMMQTRKTNHQVSLDARCRVTNVWLGTQLCTMTVTWFWRQFDGKITKTTPFISNKTHSNHFSLQTWCSIQEGRMGGTASAPISTMIPEKRGYPSSKTGHSSRKAWLHIHNLSDLLY